MIVGLVLLACAPAAAAEPAPLGQVVIVVDASGTARVGVGEPAQEGRVPALVFFGGEDAAVGLEADRGVGAAVARAVEARTALGGLPALVRFAARGAPAERVAVLDARLAGAGFAVSAVDAPATGTDPTTQVTADLAGFHRRDQPGQPAADAAEAVRWLITAARYGYGHGEPAFEPGPDGTPRMLRPAGWQEPATGYACPFPMSPALAPPPGMALEIYLAGDGAQLNEEAMGTWCDRAARALLAACGGDGLLAELEAGPAEVHWAPPPAEGLWWIVPERVVPPGGSTMGADGSCLAEALDDWAIAAIHRSAVIRVRLVEDDLQQGCARTVEERCQ